MQVELNDQDVNKLMKWASVQRTFDLALKVIDFQHEDAETAIDELIELGPILDRIQSAIRNTPSIRHAKANAMADEAMRIWARKS